MKTQLSTKVRLLAFTTMASTLMGAAAVAPAMAESRSSESLMTVASSSVTVEAVVASQSESISEVTAEASLNEDAQGSSIAAPATGLTPALSELFNFFISLLFGGFDLGGFFLR